MISVCRVHLLYLILMMGLAFAPNGVVALDNKTTSQAPTSVDKTNTSNAPSDTSILPSNSLTSEQAANTVLIPTDPLLVQQSLDKLSQDMTVNRDALNQQRASLQTVSNALALLETKFQEASKRLDNATQGVSTTQENLDKLREELLSLSRDVRANSSDLSSQKSLIEDNSVRLYEILIRISTVSDRVDELSNSLKQANNTDTLSQADVVLEQGLKRIWLMVAIVLGFLAPLALLLTAKRFNTQVVIGDIKQYQGALWVCLAGFLGFFLVGFGVTYGRSAEGLLGISSYLFSNPTYAKDSQISVPFGSFVLYQASFVLFAVMLVYRMVGIHLSLTKHLLLALFIGMILIPVFSHWVGAGRFDPNNRGWLEEVGFIDQAGAVTVNVVAAWFAFIVAWRLGSVFAEESTEQDYYAPVYSSGAAILIWLAGFGFIVGGLPSSSEQIEIALLNISLAGAAGGLTTLLYYKLFHPNPNDRLQATNGFVAGWVAMAAGAHLVGYLEALVIGGVAGLLQPFLVRWLRQVFLKQAWQIPTAHLVAIHGIGGVWGALCVGVFGMAGNFTSLNTSQLMVQIQGIAAALAYSLALGSVAVVVLKPRGKSQRAINDLSVN